MLGMVPQALWRTHGIPLCTVLIACWEVMDAYILLLCFYKIGEIKFIICKFNCYKNKAYL